MGFVEEKVAQGQVLIPSLRCSLVTESYTPVYPPITDTLHFCQMASPLNSALRVTTVQVRAHLRAQM